MQLMPFLNVHDFGALGDGVADDTESLQRTFDAAVYQTVVIPKGSYRTGTITIPAHVDVSFQNGAVLVLQDDADLEWNGTLSAGIYRQRNNLVCFFRVGQLHKRAELRIPLTA